MERADAVVRQLKGLGDRARLAGMARYGIATGRAIGVPVSELRRLAKTIGTDQRLAGALWDTGIHEARILASMVGDPGRVTEGQLDAWVLDLDSWDVCDQLCGNLVDRTPFAFHKAAEWSGREEEFVKRAGFATMASAAVHRKDVPDETFEAFLRLIRSGASDDRNYVKKAVSWALRRIGKRSPGLRRRAIVTARQIRQIDARSARWIATDVLRELESDQVARRVRSAAHKG